MIAPGTRLVEADYPGAPATVEQALRSGRALVPPRWGLWDLLLMCVGALLCAGAVSAVMNALDAPFIVATVSVILAPWVFLAGWPILITRVRGNGAAIDLGLRLTWRDTGIGLIAGVVTLIAGALTALATMAVFGDFTSAAGGLASEIVESSGRPTWLLFAVVLAVLAPIVEELAFRGFAYASLRKRGLPVWAVVVVSAGLFALLHFEPVRLPMLLVVGIILGIVRARTGVVGPSMVAHALNNLPGAVLVAMGLPGVTP